ncbi:MAG: hypothetical protein WDO13_16505 [Verrucomicrobiota bacterium]
MGLIVAQILSVASSSIVISRRNIDASSQARLAFDRIRMDLAWAVKRDDADFQAQNVAVGATATYLLFLSEVTSAETNSSGNRGVSVIAYQVNAHPDNNNPAVPPARAKSIDWGCAGFLACKATACRCR